MIVITGHTSGIGKELQQHLSERESCMGLSRSNGFDINNIDDIVSKTQSVGTRVFINNAYAENNIQSKLLMAVSMIPDIRVINIGSISAYRQDANTHAQIEYASNKTHLKATHEHLHRLGFDTTLVELGAVDTEYNKYKKCPKLGLKDLHDVFDLIVYSKVNVHTIRIQP